MGQHACKGHEELPQVPVAIFITRTFRKDCGLCLCSHNVKISTENIRATAGLTAKASAVWVFLIKVEKQL